MGVGERWASDGERWVSDGERWAASELAAGSIGELKSDGVASAGEVASEGEAGGSGVRRSLNENIMKIVGGQ